CAEPFGRAGSAIERNASGTLESRAARARRLRRAAAGAAAALGRVSDCGGCAAARHFGRRVAPPHLFQRSRLAGDNARLGTTQIPEVWERPETPFQVCRPGEHWRAQARHGTRAARRRTYARTARICARISR